MYNRIIINYPDNLSEEFKNKCSKLEIFINKNGEVEKIEATDFNHPCFNNMKCCKTEEGCEFCYPESFGRLVLEDGDIIVYMKGIYGVYDGTKIAESDVYPTYITLHTCKSCTPQLYMRGELRSSFNIHKASPEEKEMFVSALAKAGYEWDSLGKRLNRL